jgi:hypothetical protein
LVTQSVGELRPDEIHGALFAGVRAAESLRIAKLIRAAAINLRGQTRIVGGESSSLSSNESSTERNLVHA